MKTGFGIELFGFNKKDVSRYIQKLSKQAKDYDEELVVKYDTLRKEHGELEERFSLVEIENRELKSALDEKEKQISCVKQILSDVGGQIDSALEKL